MTNLPSAIMTYEVRRFRLESLLHVQVKVRRRTFARRLWRTSISVLSEAMSTPRKFGPHMLRTCACKGTHVSDS
eukprot:1407001-Pyramimonas_sp.AAC.2